MILDEIVKEAAALQLRKEDENTWSRVNDVLMRLSGAVVGPEDVRRVLESVSDLIVRSMQSDRSRLAGTALGFLKNCICILGNEFGMAGQYLVPLAKVCGKSSKVFYSRGEEVLVELCKRVNIKGHARFFSEYCGSANKNVRLAIFRGIEAWGSESGKIEGLENLVIKGREDAFSEVREVCKRMMEKFSIGERKEGCFRRQRLEESLESGVKKGPVRMARMPVRGGYGGMEGIGAREMEKKELAPKFSPARKQTKTGDKDYDKIRELSRQVKDIAEDIRPNVGAEKSSSGRIRTKIKEMFSRGSDKAGTVYPESKVEIPKEVMNHEDLTPVRLDKYLSRYREEYGRLIPKNITGVSNGFEVEDTELGEEFLEAKEVSDEDKARIGETKEEDKLNGSCEEKKERIVVGNESFDEEMGHDLEGGDEVCAELEIGELSKSLANISINEGDVEDKPHSDGDGMLSEASGNPYENLVEGQEMESSLKEYTIMDSGKLEEHKENNRDESRLCRGSGASIGESTISIDSEVENQRKERKKGCRNALEMMKGNRFAGFLELSESSEEETVFSRRQGERKEGVEKQDADNTGDFTAMDSLVEVRRGVFRKK
ncbi:uncharacterized protein Eint_100970 [Encephalitozoon intestinalis ATCC 50506]|uniref:CLASP N-terminal domain-containing protein n=1 Tax=Encephalitozoon intestinalis (strain ATCC 50506) TaxID=876142 RepID=E0S9N8_ENCIT|nr:uncharacterized protein Eint_100970 [Encephalitozoon intestinalis ATCC 50506]ADM12423.1 hypothetical protein Eint_100970 [Encephalitozoon intestinalis ATCC 50506]UTX46257.1 hypothetical protein GPK93_10g18550 [Encephalitozoon intestinalis]